MVKHISIRSDIGNAQQAEYAEELSDMQDYELIEEFLSYLDYTDETDSGTVFHPVTIGSCRAMIGVALEQVLKEMRKR